jgi:hypothetical protein
MIHIGEEIHARLRSKRMQVAEFSRQINTNRNNAYDIFTRQSIDSSLLIKISEALEFDFFRLYSLPLSQNKNIQQFPDPQENLKELEEIKFQIEKLVKENAVLKERIKDKDLIIELLRTSL